MKAIMKLCRNLIRDLSDSIEDRLDNAEVLEVLLVVQLGALRSLQLAYTQTVMLLFSGHEFMPKPDFKVLLQQDSEAEVVRHGISSDEL